MYDSKPWYSSKAIWGGVSSILAGAGLLFGIEINVNEVAALTEALLSVGTIVGGIIAVIGRAQANKRIK